MTMNELDFITETTDSWEFLRTTELPVFIYGMGDGCEKILRVFSQYSIPTAGIFASDEFVRGHSFKGHLVHTLSEIEAAVPEFVVVLAFGAGYESLYRRIEDIASRHILLAPDVPVVGDGLFTYGYALENARKIRRVYDLLADERSRQTFADVLNFRISGKIEYLTRCTASDEEINSLIPLSDDEIYMDLGAYNGDTVTDFLKRTGGKYSHIYAAEPDRRNYGKLCRSVSGGNITSVNAAAWDSDGQTEFAQNSGRSSTADMTNQRFAKRSVPIETVRPDTLCDHATLIKMDVEGAESRAIKGAESSLKNGARLICALYHRTEDMFELPLMIHEIAPDLKLYIRHKMYIPAWETCLYACR